MKSQTHKYEKDMNKKTILITGASDGIGKVTAITLAKQGHHIIIHGRNKQKTEAALEEIKKESGNNNIDVYLADFLSLEEVRKFAETIKRNYGHLDVLINNAGAQFTEKRELTTEGFEKTMVINTFAPMLLTTLLLDTLQKSKSARVITVSSASHSMGGKPTLGDIELSQGYTMTKAYAWSKLYIIWIMNHFIKHTKDKGIENITFNVVHPGSTDSSLGRESTKSLKWKIIYYLWKPMMNSMEKAIYPSIFTATSPEMEGVSGKYFGPKGEEKPSNRYYSAENEQKVWDYAMNVIQPYLNATKHSNSLAVS